MREYDRDARHRGDALQDSVYNDICAHAEFPGYLEKAVNLAAAYQVVVITCASGKHRSVALGRKLAGELIKEPDRGTPFRSIVVLHCSLAGKGPCDLLRECIKLRSSA